MPSLTGGFIVQAFTDEPATVSSSDLVPPAQSNLVLSPSAVNRPVPIGRSLTLVVRLVDKLGERSHRPGVRVALGQVVYGQYALVPGQTSISGRPVGQSPVIETTDSSGEARFFVQGVQPQLDPVFFQAWIAPTEGVPHGYSNLVSVQFTGRRVT